jgi:hypothetical protein
MDLRKTIRDLYEEKARLEEAIASLEGLLAAKSGGSARAGWDAPPKKRRGRTSMPPEERKIVSQRMKRYWAQRRAAQAK